MEPAAAQPARTTPPVVLRHVVAGVDGGRRAGVAAEQAIRLAAGARLTFVAVAHVVGSGPNEQAALSAERAEQALDRARRLARDAGIDADTQLVHGPHAAEALMKRATGADLLVIGAPLHGRVGGIAEGATSARVVHRAAMPVLIARRPGDATPFPQRILLATDGSGGSHHATQLALALAVAHDARITMVHAGDSSPLERRRMAEQAALVTETLDVEPVWIEPASRPAESICEAALQTRASLVVVGARGVSGLRALGSVSERVAHQAPCSVLIARG